MNIIVKYQEENVLCGGFFAYEMGKETFNHKEETWTRAEINIIMKINNIFNYKNKHWMKIVKIKGN